MSHASDSSLSEQFVVNSRLLLGLYIVVPGCLLFVLIDKLFLNGVLLDDHLPLKPSDWAFWTIVFNFPHIISSFITLADKEYISFYKKQFSKGLAVITGSVIVVFVILPILIPDYANYIFAAFFGLFATFTMYHVLSQQFGIGMMLMKVPPSKLYEYWRWSATIASTMTYALVFGRDVVFERDSVMAINLVGFDAFFIVKIFTSLFVIAACYFGYKLTKDSKRKLGTWYVYSNLLMLVSTYLFLLMGYTIFVIAIPRFIHDVTAFIVYCTHDQNRNTRKIKPNYFYRLLAFLPLPSLIICPLLAITLANSISCAAHIADAITGLTAIAEGCASDIGVNSLFTVSDKWPGYMQIYMPLTFICGFFHYYIESFVWKRESIHRHSVSFS